MRFEEFTQAVVEKIREYLPKTFAEASVEIQTVVKNNDLKLTGLIIRNEGNNVCPTIYLEQFFEAYKAGEEMDKVLEHIADIRVKNDVQGFDTEQITDFERVKNKIVPRLLGREWNAELLSGRPYTVIADLAVTFYILLGEDKSRIASVPIANDLMESWGINSEELQDIAVRNMLKLVPSTFRGMSLVMNRLSGGRTDVLDPADETLFVLSNEAGMYGAAAILDETIMKKVVEQVGEEFYILPSSVHELIIVSNSLDMDVEELAAMVISINASEVTPEERLSDHVYRYTIREGLMVVR